MRTAVTRHPRSSSVLALAVLGLSCGAGGAGVSSVSIGITPTQASMDPNSTMTFAATVTGTALTAVTWAVAEASGCGTATQAGVYSSPATANTCHVVVTSQADPSKTASARVTVNPAPAGVVNRVRYFPRAGQAAAMRGGAILGSNDSSTNGFVTLGTITSAPAEGQWSELTFGSATAYRWVKYQGPGGNTGSVAELQFLSGDTQLSGTPYGTPGTTGHDAAQAFDGSTSTYYEGAGTLSNYVGFDLAAGRTVAAPSFAPGAGVYSSSQSVTIATDPVDATIRYTIDGSDPSSSGTARTYSAPISISATTTLRAVATATGYYPSAEQTGLYTIGASSSSLSAFFLGNSLTDSVLNGNFLVLVSAAGGKTLTQSYFTGAGAGTYIYWYGAGQGSGGSVSSAPRTWVQGHAVDAIFSQPAANMPCLPSGHVNDTSDHGNWSDGANIQITWEDEHARNSDVQMWIHETWLAPPTPTGQGFQSNCFVGGWNRDSSIWSPAAPTNDWDASMEVYRQYNEAVRTALINAHPTWKTPYIVPSGVGLKNLKAAVAAGSIPGWGTGEFWSRVFDASNPPDHLTPVGRYFVSLIFYASTFQADPRALADTNLGTTATLSSAQAAALQQVAYDTVSNYALSGYAR